MLPHTFIHIFTTPTPTQAYKHSQIPACPFFFFLPLSEETLLFVWNWGTQVKPTSAQLPQPGQGIGGFCKFQEKILVFWSGSRISFCPVFCWVKISSSGRMRSCSHIPTLVKAPLARSEHQSSTECLVPIWVCPIICSLPPTKILAITPNTCLYNNSRGWLKAGKTYWHRIIVTTSSITQTLGGQEFNDFIIRIHINAKWDAILCEQNTLHYIPECLLWIQFSRHWIFIIYNQSVFEGGSRKNGYLPYDTGQNYNE